ncbi:MAG TPA: ester cyclase [Candidatus Sulfotelmatobacter sp.]|nr:ester cyclase [Candidatus Sulfotelmatobacter sp.]
MNTTQQKNIAKDFLTMIVSGQIDEAYDKYVDLSGKHHNLFTPAGIQALRDGMKENDGQFPNKKLNIKHIVSDGDIVIAHSHLVMKPGTKGMVVVHVLRFNKDKIVELWDSGQTIPDKSINSDGAF